MDTVQVTLTFTRAVLVHGLPRNYTASLSWPVDEYLAKTPEQIEALVQEKVNKYVTRVEGEESGPTRAEVNRQVAEIDGRIAALREAKAVAATADEEIAELEATKTEITGTRVVRA